jgi:hypothetical protein
MKYLKLFESFEDKFGISEEKLRYIFVDLVDDFEITILGPNRTSIFRPGMSEPKVEYHIHVSLKPHFQYYNTRLESFVNFSNFRLTEYMESLEFAQKLVEINNLLERFDLGMKNPYVQDQSIRILIYKKN